MNMEEKILQVPIEDIIPNRFQPRLTFDDEALQELATSIKEHGIIQPLVLRKLGDKYEIIAGERRYKAAQIAGLTTVPAVISDIDDDKSAEVALVENIQRKNLTAIEEAKSYKNILDRGYLTQEQLAEKIGISQSTIANKMRLLNLCDEVQDALLKEKISERHARALLAIKDPTEQIKWLNKILNDRLTVRQLDIEIKKALKGADDDDSDIPIVELTPNIDKIKENALDINPAQGLHDIESMLKPTEEQKIKEENIQQQNKYNLDEVELLDIDGVDTKEEMPNKFFNFLEDESANMNNDSSIDDLSYKPEIKDENDNIETLLTDDSDNTTNNNILEDAQFLNDDTFDNNNNVLDNLSDTNNDTLQDTQLISENKDNIIVDNSLDTNNDTLQDAQFLSDDTFDNNNNNIEENATPSIEAPEERPHKNTFFNFDFDSNDEQDNSDIINNDNSTDDFNSINTIDDEANNVIEINEEKKEDIFDPMSMVNTLEPDYEEKVEEEQVVDLKTAIEKFRDTKETLEAMGFTITFDEADTGDNYNININIIK